MMIKIWTLRAPSSNNPPFSALLIQQMWFGTTHHRTHWKLKHLSGWSMYSVLCQSWNLIFRFIEIKSMMMANRIGQVLIDEQDIFCLWGVRSWITKNFWEGPEGSGIVGTWIQYLGGTIRHGYLGVWGRACGWRLCNGGDNYQVVVCLETRGKWILREDRLNTGSFR